MKHKSNILISSLLFLAMLGFNACKNKDLETDSFKIERERAVATADSVRITGSYSFTGTVEGMMVNIGEKESLIDASSYPVQLAGTDFSVSIGHLKPSTEYYYCFSVDFGTNDNLLTDTKSFTTLEATMEVPTVTTLEVLAIDSSTFRVTCKVNSDGGAAITERGVCWNTYGNPNIDDESLAYASPGLGEYSCRITGLAPAKKHYVRAYAKNSAGMGYGEVLEFETPANPDIPVEIQLSSHPEEGGVVTGAGTYQVGDQCTATAEANPGYTFVNWTENGNQVSSESSYTFTVTVDRSLVANFSSEDYIISVEINPEDGGTVTGAGGYSYGNECTLTATPKTGHTFEKWTKGSNTVSTNAEYTFIVRESAIYTAHFKKKSYTIATSANPTNGGTTTGGGTYHYGDNCTVNATAATGYAFIGWKEGNETVSDEASYSFTVTGERNLVAIFMPSYTIAASANPPLGGTVTGAGNYLEGEACTLTATANNDYAFTNWTEDGNVVSADANYTFVVNSSRSLTAHFTRQYTITVSANPTDGGTVHIGNTQGTTQATFNEGETCIVHATINEGYSFESWTENGSEVSSDENYFFTVESNRNLVANFSELPTVPTGGIDGLFSVSPSKQVYFAKGNLQFQASTSTWRFADNQWDFVGGTYQGVQYGTVSGSSNNSIGASYSGWIDLFGFGTSGWNSGATAYQPYSTSQNNTHYYPGGSFANDLTDAYVQADWAYHNPISNGGNQTGLWRCLTHEEYVYLIEGRVNAAQKYSLGRVNNINGLIILPDEWTLPSGLSFTPHAANHNYNVYSVSQWQQMEAAGAVFLPVTGSRQANIYFAIGKQGSITIGLGDYWSSTAIDNETGHSLSFMNNNTYPADSRYRMLGTAVRPVYEIKR